MRIFAVILLMLFSAAAFAQSDNPCGAPNIPVNSSCTYSLVDINYGIAYQSNPPNFGPITCGASGPDAWYSFTAPPSGNVTIQTSAGNIFDGVMALYSATCPTSYNLIACDDDSGPGLMPLINATGLTPGATYYIRLWEWLGFFTGWFEVCVVESAAASGNQNCSNATGICSNASFSGNSSGFGIQELNAANAGCLFIEHQSSWYTFTAQTTGTLAMTIAPVNGTDDYDFAIWGPFSPCAPTNTPARCSYAAGGGNTGLQAGSGDVTEDAFGDRWVDDIVITAGEDYVMVIDNWSVSSSPFNLTWGGTASLDCAIILPVELVDFGVYNSEGANVIYWVTATETNNDYFTIERSTDGKNFEPIAFVNGAGNSNTLNWYNYKDASYLTGINYYRLIQTDYDGTEEIFDAIQIDNSDDRKGKVVKVLNTMGQVVDEHFKGFGIMVFENGSREKRMIK